MMISTPDPDEERVDPVIDAGHHELSKHCAPMRVYRTIGDPVLLSQCGRSVDDKFLQGIMIIEEEANRGDDHDR